MRRTGIHSSLPWRLPQTSAALSRPAGIWCWSFPALTREVTGPQEALKLQQQERPRLFTRPLLHGSYFKQHVLFLVQVFSALQIWLK